jgi:hypothetical protein
VEENGAGSEIQAEHGGVQQEADEEHLINCGASGASRSAKMPTHNHVVQTMDVGIANLAQEVMKHMTKKLCEGDGQHEFKLAIRLQRQSCDDVPRVEITPQTTHGVVHLVVNWMPTNNVPVKLGFTIDEVDKELADWFLTDRVAIPEGDTFIDIYTVSADKDGAFNVNEEKIFHKLRLFIDEGLIPTRQKFVRCVRSCIRMKRV